MLVGFVRQATPKISKPHEKSRRAVFEPEEGSDSPRKKIPIITPVKIVLVAAAVATAIARFSLSAFVWNTKLDMKKRQWRSHRAEGIHLAIEREKGGKGRETGHTRKTTISRRQVLILV